MADHLLVGIDLVSREPAWGFTVPDGCWLVTLGSRSPPGPLWGVYHGRESPWPMGPCPFGPSLSACFGLLVLTTVQKHVCVPTHSNLAHKIPQSGSASSCFAPLASPMRPGVKRSHEGGAVTSTLLGWELDESPHPHIHPVIKGCVCLCLSSPWTAPSFERTSRTPLRTARMSFPISSSSLSNAPFGDAAWPRLTRGYGLAGDSWDATTPDWPRRLTPLSSARRCGDCASPSGL